MDLTQSDEQSDLLGPAEGRVLGCLIEKERTTPADYPLTAASLVRACNQSTSRDPVVEFSEQEVRDAVDSLKGRGLLRVVHSISNRAARFRHVLAERWILSDAEVAVLGVLLLRGPQTAGELRTRTERLWAFDSVDEVGQILAQLLIPERGLVVEVERRPGQKERRWAQIVAEQFEGSDAVAVLAGPSSSSAFGAGHSSASESSALAEHAAALTERVALLEISVAVLSDRLNALINELG